MKKISVVVLSLFIVLSLSACGKSEAAKSVDEAIEAIGIVSIDSESAIVNAENAYNALSDADKNDVEKYDSLVKAREEYDAAVKAEIESLINDANEKIDELDMKGAYEIALDLPEEYSKERDSIIEKVDRMCYENTFLCKVENVVSKMPKTTANRPEVNMVGGLTVGNEYADEASMSTAFKEYYDYMNKYYKVKNSDSTSEAGQLEWANQKFVFEDEKGHSIEINSLSASLIGSFYYFNIVIEKNVNYRDVIEIENE